MCPRMAESVFLELTALSENANLTRNLQRKPHGRRSPSKDRSSHKREHKCHNAKSSHRNNRGVSILDRVKKFFGIGWKPGSKGRSAPHHGKHSESKSHRSRRCEKCVGRSSKGVRRLVDRRR